MAARAQSAILIGALALLAGLAVLILWLVRAPAPAPEPDVGAATANVAAESPSPRVEVFEPPLADVSAPTRRDDALSGARPDDGSWFEVLLRYDEDGLPAAGATLYCMSERERAHPSFAAELARLGQGRQFFERNARSHVADQGGRTRVPFERGHLALVAIGPEHFGTSQVELKSLPGQPLVLGMRRAHGIEVRVSRAGSGEPVAGVEVLALRHSGLDVAVGGETDARGILRLWPLFIDPNLNSRWYAKIFGVLREEARASFTLDQVSPLELSLPPTLPVLVYVVDANGRTLGFDGELDVGWRDSEGDPAPPLQVLIQNGVANLPCVEVGLEVRLRAQLEGVDQKPTTKFELKSASDSRARVELRLETPPPLVRARLVDGEGAPVANAAVSAEASLFHGGQTLLLEFGAKSRGDGAVLFAVEGAKVSHAALAIALEAKRAGQPSLGGVFHAPMQPGTTEMGELHLETVTRLFAGIVVNAEDQPMSGALVELGSDLSQSSPAIGRARTARSGKDGRFEVWGWSEDGIFELEASLDEKHAGKLLARRGDMNVRIRME